MSPWRLIVLGASNLTRGFATVVELARQLWGPDVEIFAALGHGRSYGIPSRVLFRGLPGILQAGLWQALERAGPAAGRAFVTDVGNDILYDVPVPEILAWVGESVERLQRAGASVVLTSLPLDGIRRLSPLGYLAFRSILVPACRLPFGVASARAEELAAGLEALAAQKHGTFLRPRPEWYGVDPIHIRPRFWSRAWRDILLAGEPEDDRQLAPPPFSLLRWLRLYAAPAERFSLFGFELRASQPALTLASGQHIWLF